MFERMGQEDYMNNVERHMDTKSGQKTKNDPEWSIMTDAAGTPP